MAHILMVEDNDLVAEVFARVLAGAGHDVDHSISGQGAAYRIVHNQYDLVLMDVALPGPPGDTVASAMRDLGFDGPIVVLTGGALSMDAAEARHAHFAEVLRKPIMPADLVVAIERHLSG